MFSVAVRICSRFPCLLSFIDIIAYNQRLIFDPPCALLLLDLSVTMDSQIFGGSTITTLKDLLTIPADESDDDDDDFKVWVYYCCSYFHFLFASPFDRDFPS